MIDFLNFRHLSCWNLTFSKGFGVDMLLKPQVQREFARIGLNQEVFAKQFTLPKGFDLGTCKLEVDYFLKPAADTPKLEAKDEELEEIMRKNFQFQVFTVGQTIAVDYNGTLLKFDVRSLMPPDSWTCSVGALEGYHLRKR